MKQKLFTIAVVGISGLFGLAENHILMLDMGIVQRVLYLVGLVWLVYEERIILRGGKFQNERK